MPGAVVTQLRCDLKVQRTSTNNTVFFMTVRGVIRRGDGW
jgi:hypothetical protein